MQRNLILIAVLFFTSVGLCQADWLGRALGEAGKRLGERAVNETGDSMYDTTKGGARNGVNNNSSTAREEPSSPQSARNGSSVQEAGVSMEEAEKAYSKFDFIPGAKTIFYDDFSDTDVGEFPRKWTLQGPKTSTNNTVDVVEYLGRRFLRSVPNDNGQHPATQYLRLDQKGNFPEKFTIEFDAVFAPINDSPVYYIRYNLLLVPPDGKINFRSGPNLLVISGEENRSANTTTNIQLNDGKVHRVAISINGTFVKAYIDNQRVINDPDGIKRPIKQIGLQMTTPNGWKTEKLMFTNFRLAEGGKEIKAALDTEGKIVTHGILFDTGKAVIKLESLPTLRMILGLLNNDPGLKFSIEGHTDSQGGAGINKPLSERRAEAVKTWLEGKGIASARLKSAGFGDSKPLDSNKTPEGRANNRRVEFVRF